MNITFLANHVDITQKGKFNPGFVPCTYRYILIYVSQTMVMGSFIKQQPI